MMVLNLTLSFIVFGSLAQAAELSHVYRSGYRTSATLSSDATQSDILSQIDKGVLDFNPSLAGPNWVIYPEDYPKIGVATIDRQKSFEPKKIEETDENFGEDADVDEILVK